MIVLIGDDHSSTAVGCYGNKIARTPNIDRIASKGIKFTNAYSNAPVCSASRQSILCGKYPHATGVTLLRTAFKDSGNLTLAEILRGNNYKTAVIGKTHFNNSSSELPPDHGFDIMIDHNQRKKYFAHNLMPPIPDSIKTLGPWKPFRDPARIWLNADVLPTAERAGYGLAAFDARNAIEFIRNNKDEKFLLWLGFHEPHSPFNFPVEYAGKYDPFKITLPKGSPEDVRFVPEIFRDLSDEDKQGVIASYYTSAEYMDENIGKILDEVTNLGLDENTLIIYLGDQGYLLGEHKRFEKHTMWDPAIKAPLIFSLGGKQLEIKSNNSIVQFIDVVPTILDLLDLKIPDEMQGHSLVPILNSSEESINDLVFAEFLVDNKAMVTDGKWKYIFTTGQRDLGQGYATGYGPSGILHKLYNLKTDPEESTNVSLKPENAEILNKLQEQMLGIFIETHPFSSEIPENLTIEEQLIWFCEPRDEGADLDAK
ncbi:MAG: sulfatase-like hydrolase/transferase [Bacteroidales bacterium]|nr:sulfatase-like hydrolase/transferase [Bacteroidales bacterium]